MFTLKIALIQKNFVFLQSQSDRLVDLFYGRLFSIAPEVKPLFTGDMHKQGQKLMGFLQLAILGLQEPQNIIPAIKSLGERHHDYGVTQNHYPLVGEALLWAIAELSGEQFTAELEDAWTEAYYLLAGLMKEASTNRQAQL
ncbi:MAG: hypothetical protein KDE51_12375 [Anaerolineales bacterium]|nr:hypothetical protein [Anaerolineales bacterium]